MNNLTINDYLNYDIDQFNYVSGSAMLGETTDIEELICRSDIGKMRIDIRPSLNNSGLYFIVMDGDRDDATKIARISILEPKYIHCNDCRLPEWKLDKDDKNELMYCLTKQKPDYDEYANNWEFILKAYNFQVNGLLDKISEDLAIPNYLLL